MSDEKTTGRTRDLVVTVDRIVRGMAVRWLAILNVLVFIYVGLPFAAPVLMANGATGPANTIYSAYSFVCHQFAFRSWYAGGEQVAYPREQANSKLGTFESYAVDDPAFDGVDVTTLDVFLVTAARAFRGNEVMGYKVGFCQRDVAMYTGILLSGLAFGLMRKKLKPLKFWQYVLLAIVPMGLDGFSQMFSNPPFSDPELYGAGYGLIGGLSQAIFGLRESTPFLRTLTGLMFGLGSVWLAYPYLEEAMRDTRQQVESQLAKAGVAFDEAQASSEQ